MKILPDPVTDADLNGYVDDQIDVARRIEVEAYLAERPETAARVMADFAHPRRAAAGARGSRQRIQAIHPLTPRGDWSAASPSAASLAICSAWQRSRCLSRPVGLPMRRSGPFSISEVVASTPPPAYVEDAMRAHGTSVLRASMASQPEVSAFDAEEIRSATAIVMPTLPADWAVRDVQIYPSRFGPSVEMAIETDELGLLSLFAVRPGTFDVITPTLAPSDDASSCLLPDRRGRLRARRIGRRQGTRPRRRTACRNPLLSIERGENGNEHPQLWIPHRHQPPERGFV